MIRRLAWLTTAAARGEDVDEALALPALAAAGADVRLVDWDDPDVDWSGFDRAVLRSTWDYPERRAEFLTRLDEIAAATDLRNPPDVVRWSMDKHYLADLAKAGVPVTATTFVEPGDEPVLPAGEFVVKPAIGAGSRDAASYAPEQADLALAHVRRLQAQGAAALVQPLLPSVATEGEWPFLFFGGRFSHAASKRVTLPRGGTITGLYAAETNAAWQPEPAQLEVAHAALEVAAARFGSLAYARVDLVRAEDGSPVVLELELVEPSLFLPQAAPGAAGALAAALVAT